jgi:hypothetical protein
VAPVDYSSMPNLVWLAWLGTGTCLLAVHATRSVFPTRAVALSVSKAAQGNALALIAYAQAFTALCAVKGRTWMYRPLPVALFGVIGVAGLVLFGLADTPVGFYVGALCLGVYAGTCFMYMAFHALVHPTRAGRYVGINESLVGLTGIVAPASAGMLADHTTLQTPYFVAAVMVAVVICVQVTVHLGHREAARSLGSGA